MSTADRPKKLKRLAPRAITGGAQVLLQVRMWSGTERQLEPPSAAVAMVEDLLAISSCVTWPGRVETLDAEFADAHQAVRVARQAQRLIHGFSCASPLHPLDSYILLSRVEDEVPPLDLALLSAAKVLRPAGPAQILMVGTFCEVARAIPGLHLETLPEAVVEPDRQGRSRELLHLLPAVGVEDRSIESAPEIAVPGPQHHASAPSFITTEPPTSLPDLEVLRFTRLHPVNRGASLLLWASGALGAVTLGLILFFVGNKSGNSPKATAPPNEVSAPTAVIPTATSPAVPPSLGRLEQPVPAATETTPKSHKERVAAKRTVALESEARDEKEKAQGDVLGFSHAEINSLLTKADQDSGDGRYDRAIFEYQTVLKSEPGNAQAKEGLARAIRNKASQ